mmetsp:Transcript_6657/g.16529  ORF Transcript_6657/g.16529 Transcript_6657/m.16529 type:complete len:250 (+) Transcript_6657:1301-2050(+)
MRRHVGMVLFAKAPSAFGVSAIKIVLLWALDGLEGGRRRRPPWQIEPTRALETVPRLVHAAPHGKFLVYGGLARVSPREGLVVREDNRVSLRVTLVGTVPDPTAVHYRVVVETRAVETEEVDLGRSSENPSSEFAANAPTEHQAHRVEATSVVEPANARLRTDKRLVVRREGLRATHRRLDACGLDDGAPLHVACQILAEGVIVQFEEPESEARVHVWPEFRVLLVPPNGHRVALRLEVYAQVVVPYVG